LFLETNLTTLKLIGSNIRKSVLGDQAIFWVLVGKAGSANFNTMKVERYSFFEDVWDVVRLVPKGKVTTYGAIAEYLGTKMSARMVGWAMNACPADVPAQRVVNRNGLLTGKHHFPEQDLMQKLLEKEGIQVFDDKVQNLAKVLWHPRELET
jgi:methylated-DNA-protein-cysteine methyltransferase-like protein